MKWWPWQDSNLQSLVPKTNALSIRPQGQFALQAHYQVVHANPGYRAVRQTNWEVKSEWQQPNMRELERILNYQSCKQVNDMGTTMGWQIATCTRAWCKFNWAPGIHRQEPARIGVHTCKKVFTKVYRWCFDPRGKHVAFSFFHSWNTLLSCSITLLWISHYTARIKLQAP